MSEDSAYRLQNMCDCLPETVHEADTDRVGFHRKCMQKFTKNLDRLSNDSVSQESSSGFRRSPRKHPGTPSNVLFPFICIFCNNKKKHETTTLTKFSSFEGRSASWKEIEPKALEMRNMPVYRRVQGQDLWAREAKFHKRCLNQFTI